MTRFSTLLDKVVDRGQYVVWCDHRTLIAEEIDEHIRDGHKIWDAAGATGGDTALATGKGFDQDQIAKLKDAFGVHNA